MVSYTSGGSSKSESTPLTNLPWRETRDLMGKARKNFVDPLLNLDLNAPALKKMADLTRSEVSKTTEGMIGKLASTPGISSPAKASLMSDAMNKIQTLAAGVPINTFKDLMAWFDKVTGSMGQMSSQQTQAGSSYGIGGSGTGEIIKSLKA